MLPHLVSRNVAIEIESTTKDSEDSTAHIQSLDNNLSILPTVGETVAKDARLNLFVYRTISSAFGARLEGMVQPSTAHRYTHWRGFLGF